MSVEHAGRERSLLRRAVGLLHLVLRADHRVGALVRLLVDAVEARAQGVGEDEAAADHRDAEDDRERGQDCAELAPEQSFEGDLDHRALTASSVARISGRSRRAEIGDDLAVGEEQDAVGDRGRAGVVRDHHGRLAETRDRARAGAPGSPSSSSSRGCPSARPRTSRSGSRREHGRSRHAAAVHRTSRPGGARDGR